MSDSDLQRSKKTHEQEPYDREKVLRHKCLTERRRRDQENHYFEELAEILSTSIADMSKSFTIKPEKCAILQETVNQIKQIKEESGSGNDVQLSQVSSSKPAILANDVLGPLLLEALDGFLFCVNSQGKVEFVSENVKLYLKYSQDDLIGKSIYNIIHVGDHAQFSSSLLPLSLGSDLGSFENPPGRGRTFNCRMLIKPAFDDDDDVEIKQTYVSQYENMQISAILQPYPADKNSNSSDNKEFQSGLVCIARRLTLADKTSTMLGVEQFTTKQDTSGKIIGCDCSGLSSGHYKYPDFVGKAIQDFCHVNDLQQLSRHLQEVLQKGSDTSNVYRFKLQENRHVFVQTKSKLFQNPVSGVSEFIMSTHSIIRECDSDNELKGSASTSLMKSIISQGVMGKNSSPLPSASSVGFMGSPLIPSPNPGGFSMSIDTSDFTSPNGNWDIPTSDILSNVNNNFSIPGSVTSTSSSSSWNTVQTSQQQQQMKLSQLQRSLSTSQTANMSLKWSLGGGNFRSNSVDSGQSGPGYNPGSGPLGGGFQVPGQRSMGMYQGQRSPAASPSPHGPGWGINMSPYSARTPSPMTSPQAGYKQQFGMDFIAPTPWGFGKLCGMSQPNWNTFASAGNSMSGSQQVNMGMSMSSQALPLQALQNLNSSSAVTSPALSNMVEARGTQVKGDKKNARTGKLCQLLTCNSGSEGMEGKGKDFKTSFSKSGMEKSPVDSMLQSPQPGPGQSPQEKPQSTSNDDFPMQNEVKERNMILKSLLSVEEEEEDAMNDSKGHKADTSDSKSSLVEMDKNEAEPKKPNNLLLKQLLGQDDNDGKDKPKSSVGTLSQSKGPQDKVLQKLLEEETVVKCKRERGESCTSAPAESTSQESEFSRQRHQSGPQEPQSTTPHVPPHSQPLTSPRSRHHSSNEALSIKESIHGSLGSLSSVKLESVSESSNLIQDKKLDNFLQFLWEKDDEKKDPREEMIRIQRHNNKRKASSSDLDMQEAANSMSDASTSQGSTSRLSQENALLTQLLSKKATKENIVNTKVSNQRPNPTEVPQTRNPKNIEEKILKVRPALSAARSNFTKEPQKGQVTSQSNNVCSSPTITAVSRNLLDSLTSTSDNFNQNTSTVNLGQSLGMGSGMNTPQFKEQYEELQQLLAQTVGDGSSTLKEIDFSSELSDPLLSQILQQAQDLQQDLNSGNVPNLLSQSSSAQVTSGVDSVSQMDDTSFLSQLEQVLEENSFPMTDIDAFLGMNTQSGPSDMNEQMAIDAIRKQLMSEDPVQGMSPSGSLASPGTLNQSPQVSLNHAGYNSVMGQPQQQPQQLQSQQNDMSVSNSTTMMDSGAFQRLLQQQQQQQSQGTGYGANPVTSYSSQGQRMPQPNGMMSVNQQQRAAMFSGMARSTTAMQVRQSLIQQQKLKQLREAEKRRQQQQQQERQRLLMQQQQQQISSQYPQRFPPMTMDAQAGGPPTFPENLADLMNSGNVPNVTLQRNQIPGPMSPRFGAGVQQNQQGMGPMMPPSPQLSPNFQQQQQQQQQQQNAASQWNIRQQQQQQANLQSSTSGLSMQQMAGGGQYQRNRSLSGGALQTAQQNMNCFSFPDNQFPNPHVSSQMNMFSPQQQVYSQGRGMQRQISMTGRGSPRSAQSPFGTSPDPLLMSPHAMSPNAALRQPPSGPQVSPPFTQGANIVPMPSMSPLGSQGMASPGFVQPSMHGMGSQDMNEVNMHYGVMDSNKNSGSTSQYVKQELRNMCNARSEKHQIHGSMMQHHSSIHVSSQAPPPQQTQQTSQPMETESELPLDILEQINEMTQEHGVGSSLSGLDDFKEEEVVTQKRQEAKDRYHQFEVLVKVGEHEEKATNLFRNQLMTNMNSVAVNSNTSISASRDRSPSASRPSLVNVVQKEPRKQIDEIKPANQQNSLLQQLLSE